VVFGVDACGGNGASELATTDAATSDVATAATTSATAATTAATSAVTEDSVLRSLTVAAPSLAGNLLGDPAEIDVLVQLPASYDDATDRRYPVVYFLAGFDESAAIAPIGMQLDRLVEEGSIEDMILVGISGNNALGGSFYVDSPVTGNWASLVLDDVVGAIDDEFRTLATSESRGIAGFSMGGFGALDLAMRHSDVFGAVYAASPGLFAPDGMAESQMFADPSGIAAFIDMQQTLMALPPEEAAASMLSAIPGGDARFALAYGMAFSPNPERAPYVDYPFTDAAAAPDPAIWARWEAGYGGIADEVDELRDNLLALRGIVIDYGIHDEYEWIPDGCEHLHEQLDAAGIPHRLERYEGGHGPVSPRAADVMLPFFDDVLVTS
jgi:enterochelin esterase-like enzyme